MQQSQSRDWRDEHGQVMVLMAIALLSMLVMVGLVLDMGMAMEHRRQLQNAVDAAALAGAQMLPDTTAAATQADHYFWLNEPTMGSHTLTIDFPSGDQYGWPTSLAPARVKSLWYSRSSPVSKERIWRVFPSEM